MSETTVIGVDLGGTKVTVGAVSGGTVRHVSGRRISAHRAQDVVMAEVIEAIEEEFDDTVVGIGCGVPSVVDVETGVVVDVENIPSWRRVPLKAVLEDRFEVPTYVNNDANAFAVGEHVFGKGQAFQDMVGLTLGTGLGAGVIIDGRLYCGKNCGAGEIGMIPHKRHNVEAYCSGRFFKRECGMAGEVAYRRALEGDAVALRCFERFGHQMGDAVMIVTYAFDPEAVIMGGSISVAFDLFEGGMRERLRSFAYGHVIEGLVIESSELENAALLGAAALYVDATSR
jgi:glucokinase